MQWLVVSGRWSVDHQGFVIGPHTDATSLELSALAHHVNSRSSSRLHPTDEPLVFFPVAPRCIVLHSAFRIRPSAFTHSPSLSTAALRAVGQWRATSTMELSNYRG